MKPALAYFSFAEITDRTRHHEFNEYHQLDHRPENLALPGVIFGERWVRTPDCAQALPTAATDSASSRRNSVSGATRGGRTRWVRPFSSLSNAGCGERRPHITSPE